MYAGDDRRVAEGAGAVALPRSDFLVGGHHAADARGGSDVRRGRQQLETDHEKHRTTTTRKKCPLEK